MQEMNHDGEAEGLMTHLISPLRLKRYIAENVITDQNP
jgi:hypothetical protein